MPANNKHIRPSQHPTKAEPERGTAQCANLLLDGALLHEKLELRLGGLGVPRIPATVGACPRLCVLGRSTSQRRNVVCRGIDGVRRTHEQAGVLPAQVQRVQEGHHCVTCRVLCRNTCYVHRSPKRQQRRRRRTSA